jgi:hypothetical protein
MLEYWKSIPKMERQVAMRFRAGQSPKRDDRMEAPDLFAESTR